MERTAHVGEPDWESPDTTATAEALLTASGMTKQFPGVLALDDAGLELHRGEVHALFGENGAGKSTLTHIVAGTYSPDAGRLTLEGAPVAWRSPADARGRGVAAVFQELSLVPTLTVAANIHLGHEVKRGGRLANGHMRDEAARLLEELGHPIDPSVRVEQLSRSERQVVEIAKALRGDPSVLILDEPTVALTEQESERLFVLVERLQQRGAGIIYITHRIDELDRLADRVTVLRDGRNVGTHRWGDLSRDELIGLMTGREVRELYPRGARSIGETKLAVSGLTTRDGRVREASLTVRAGEIVGVAGLMGSGKSELARACFGLDRVEAGTIEIDGHRPKRFRPAAALAAGLVYCPGERRRDGLIGVLSVRENIALSQLPLGGFQRFNLLRRRAERRQVQRVAERLDLRPLDIDRPAGLFSGGNQQKVVLGRGLINDMKVAILEEPTAGVDVGARAEVYDLIAEFCENGIGVLIVSSDLPELLGLCQRVYVMREGEIRAELSGEDLNEERALRSFF
jgi:ribose transport system ATP-binding protein